MNSLIRKKKVDEDENAQAMQPAVVVDCDMDKSRYTQLCHSKRNPLTAHKKTVRFSREVAVLEFSCDVAIKDEMHGSEHDDLSTKIRSTDVNDRCGGQAVSAVSSGTRNSKILLNLLEELTILLNVYINSIYINSIHTNYMNSYYIYSSKYEESKNREYSLKALENLMNIVLHQICNDLRVDVKCNVARKRPGLCFAEEIKGMVVSSREVVVCVSLLKDIETCKMNLQEMHALIKQKTSEIDIYMCAILNSGYAHEELSSSIEMVELGFNNAQRASKELLDSIYGVKAFMNNVDVLLRTILDKLGICARYDLTKKRPKLCFVERRKDSCGGLLRAAKAFGMNLREVHACSMIESRYESLETYMRKSKEIFENFIISLGLPLQKQLRKTLKDSVKRICIRIYKVRSARYKVRLVRYKARSVRSVKKHLTRNFRLSLIEGFVKSRNLLLRLNEEMYSLIEQQKDLEENQGYGTKNSDTRFSKKLSYLLQKLETIFNDFNEHVMSIYSEDREFILEAFGNFMNVALRKICNALEADFVCDVTEERPKLYFVGRIRAQDVHDNLLKDARALGVSLQGAYERTMMESKACSLGTRRYLSKVICENFIANFDLRLQKRLQKALESSKESFMPMR